MVADLAQQVSDFCMEAGELFACYEGPSVMFLAFRMATIAGGTSEVWRNLLAERAPGLPNEPEPA